MKLTIGKHLRGLTGPILITGHTGFKGTWLTFLLERIGVPVVGLSLQPEQGSLFDRANRIGIIPEAFFDIRDVGAVTNFVLDFQPSAIIHMAAQPLVLESYKTPRETFETNVMGTVNILSAAFKSDSVKAVVVVTTDKVYQNDNSRSAFVESNPLFGKDPYSASKVGTEAAVAAWQQIAKVSGGPKVVSVRAGNVIGGGDWAIDRLLPDLVRSFISGVKMTVRNPASTRPWQHVLDPLNGYLMTLEAQIRGESITSINFGPDSESLEVSRIVEVACKTWPHETEIELERYSVMNFAEADSLQLNSNYAREHLRWSARWSQEEAVIATINWWDKVLNYGIDPSVMCNSEIDHLLK
jgi:CDP-glucose 4,6-dehydratase